MNSKIINGALGLIIGSVVLSDSNTISANAASWHRGTPKAIQGKWQTAGYKGKYHMLTSVHIGKKIISSGEVGLDGVGDIAWPIVSSKAEYKYLGHHTYQIKGLFFNQVHENFKAKLHGYNKLTIINHGSHGTRLYLHRY